MQTNRVVLSSLLETQSQKCIQMSADCFVFLFGFLGGLFKYYICDLQCQEMKGRR